MSHRNHHHTEPLPPHRESPSHNLPKNEFGGLVGTLDHWTLAAHDGHNPDDNHIYLWLKVAQGQFAGKYEVGVNVLSSDKLQPGEPPEFRLLRYYIRPEPLAINQWPTEGFFNAEVSFAGLNLKENDFTTTKASELRALVSSYATSCQLITAYGIVYSGGDGLHEVHMNSGNPPPREDENRVNQDGAIVFYFDEHHGGPIARWLFLKFFKQEFPE